MWSLLITAIAIASVAALYLWAVYRFRQDREEQRTADVDPQLTAPSPVEGSDWELEYLLTADYSR